MARHRITCIRLTSSSAMAEIVNLRIARKRAARSKAESRAAEQRLAHGAPNGARPRGGGPRQGPPNSRSASHRNRRPSMKSPVVKRSIVVAGHKTSVSLEDAFWKGLKEIADDRDVTLSDLVSTHRHRSPPGQSVVGDPAVRARSFSQPAPPLGARRDARPDRVARQLRQFCAPTSGRPSGSRAAAPRFRCAARARGFGAAGTSTGGGSAGA